MRHFIETEAFDKRIAGMVGAKHLFRVAVGSCVAAIACCAPAQEPKSTRTSVNSCGLQKRIMRDLKKWDSITNHRTGSEGDQATANWLAAEIRKVGLEPRFDQFEFQRRVLKDCSLRIGERRIDGVPLFDGGVTGPKPIRARLAQLGEKGTIALMEYTANPRSEASKKLMSARKRTDHLAIVAVGNADTISPGIALLNAEAYQKPYGLPVLLVSREHAKLLATALKSGQEIEFRAHVVLKKSIATNVQVTVPGQQKDLKPLVVMTPRSGWWRCTSERGGGIAVWLECIRQFAASPPTRGIIFTANTGHELGHLGLEHFLRERESLIKDAHVWIHLGANFAAHDSQLVLQASNDNYMNMLKTKLLSKNDTEASMIPVEQRPLGEARDIYDGGGHFVSILGTNRRFHHPSDRLPDAVNMQRTEYLTRGLLQIAKQLAGI